jgi:hypothetical protein
VFYKEIQTFKWHYSYLGNRYSNTNHSYTYPTEAFHSSNVWQPYIKLASKPDECWNYNVLFPIPY